MKLYSSLAEWWPLLSPPSDYADAAAFYWRTLSAHARRPLRTLLELGSGGGNTASHLKQWVQLALTDLSPDMLAVSRALNPQCEHVEGDMRAIRLARTFDAVLIHDAVMYMRTADDLRRAMATAYVHCAPGGAVLFQPDCTRETWQPETSHGGHDGDRRAIRYLEWLWDPDPEDSEFVQDMVYTLRDADGRLRVEHDRHRLGIFPRASWMQWLGEAGFEPHAEPCSFPGGERATAFVGVRVR